MSYEEQFDNKLINITFITYKDEFTLDKFNSFLGTITKTEYNKKKGDI